MPYKDPEKKRANAREHYLKNRDTVIARSKSWVEANPESAKGYKDKWRTANPEKNRELQDSYVENNREKVRAAVRRWNKDNRGSCNSAKARREAQKITATPAWANSAKIAGFYETADGLGMCTGEWYHVDHIVPLRGKTVCGLHVEHNLQVLPASDNIRKGNRRWPDMP